MARDWRICADFFSGLSALIRSLRVIRVPNDRRLLEGLSLSDQLVGTMATELHLFSSEMDEFSQNPTKMLYI
jgi:hypothetical protein